jgi:hypothetical protein
MEEPVMCNEGFRRKSPFRDQQWPWVILAAGRKRLKGVRHEHLYDVSDDGARCLLRLSGVDYRNHK